MTRFVLSNRPKFWSEAQVVCVDVKNDNTARELEKK